MVKEFTYTKQVDVGALHKLLQSYGYAVIGVTYDSGQNKCIVHLEDTEFKEPTPVVNAYVYVAPIIINWKEEFKKAATIDQKVIVIANYLRLI